MKQPLIILAGPTAAGKTALSIRLAKELSGEIISADSMQVYRGMDIGTAKIRPEEMEGIPHHLIDILDPKEPFSVMEFRKRAGEAVSLCLSHGHVPIVTGGTGFYIQSLLYDVDFEENAENAVLRKMLEEEMEKKGPEAMHEQLLRLDPESARAIHPNNRKRVIRAVEYCLLTGKRLSDTNRLQREKDSPYRFLYFVITMDRGRLYQRIDRRVDRMMAEGLLDEVRALLARGLTEQDLSMQGIGYRQLIPAARGEGSLPEAVERIRTETRHFAKRQLTWFKREREARWLSLEDFDCDEDRLFRQILSECRTLLSEEKEDASDDTALPDAPGKSGGSE